MHCLPLLQYHHHVPPSAAQTQKGAGGKKNRDAGCEQYLELIGFLNDDLEFGVLPQDWAPHLCDPTLFLLLAGQGLLFLILLCKAKSPWVKQAPAEHSGSGLLSEGEVRRPLGGSMSDRTAEKEFMEKQTG